MKKLMTLALCIAAIGSMSAQKANVEAAKKLAGKPDMIAEARALINEAIANPETANDALTYYIAGKIEMDNFDKTSGKLKIDPKANVDVIAMGQGLLNAYDYWVKAIDLDQQPNEKGQVKPKYTKDIKVSFSDHAEDFSNAGTDFYNAKMYFPEAYKAFYSTASLPKYGVAMSDSIVALLYNYAGVAGFYGDKYREAADAFKASRLAGSNDVDTYVNEINALRNMIEKNLCAAEDVDDEIMETAQAGYEKFGLQNSTFLIHIVDQLFKHDKKNDAIAFCEAALQQYPDNGDAPGVLANSYERIDDFDNAYKNYKISLSKQNVQPNVIKAAANFFFRAGAQKNNEIEPSNPEAAALKAQILQDYVQPGLDACERIKAIDPSISVADLEENLEYLQSLLK